MLNYILFFLVIAIANIIQGITGFAGTILAMPFSLILVGYPVAKPVLNVLAILSGGYVFLGNRDKVNKKVLLQVIVIMLIGIFAGIWIKDLFLGHEKALYLALGIFIILLSLEGFWELFLRKTPKSEHVSPLTYALLPLAGLVHGIFVSGGPLLIGFMSKKLPDRHAFRATISTVWIILNTIILVDDIRAGYWDSRLLITFLISIPFLFIGMRIGSRLYAKMNQRTFMIITYILLFISGLTLLFK